MGNSVRLLSEVKQAWLLNRVEICKTLILGGGILSKPNRTNMVDEYISHQNDLPCKSNTSVVFGSAACRRSWLVGSCLTAGLVLQRGMRIVKARLPGTAAPH